MHNTRAFEALRMIEVLRSGIPSRLVARAFTHGRRNLLSEVEERLSRITQEGKGGSFCFQAEYGNGKSHLLNQIFDIAWGANFVVSKVVLNKETPMNQLQVLYQKAAENCFLPDQELPGFENALFRLKPGNVKVEEFLRYCELHLHPRLKLIMEICLKGNEENQHIFYGDLLGSFVNLQMLRSAYRITFGSGVKCPAFKRTDRADIMSYFQFLTLLFNLMGYAGWVILFDEAELIERHGPVSRMKAYLNLSELLNIENRLTVPLFSVFAFASTFETFLSDKDELGLLPSRAGDRMGERASSAIKKTIEQLLKIRALPELTGEDLENIAREVASLHGEAFGWKPDINLREILTLGTVERRVRTMVRGAIQRLDLAFLGRPTQIRVEDLPEEMLPEDERFFDTSTDEPSECE